MEKETVFWGRVEHGDWTMYVVVHKDGRLCCVTVPGEVFEAMEMWIHQHHPGADLVFDPDVTRRCREELLEYLRGERRTFTMPLAPHGTPFQTRVWQTLMQIPYGEVWTYADLARAIGRPTAVRAVAAANGANPMPIVVPCHRVIGSDGTLTGYSGGLHIKARLLELEGHRLWNGKRAVSSKEIAALTPRTRVVRAALQNQADMFNALAASGDRPNTPGWATD
ncbi:methylated-DNA--[protein]-cysteine S-methyltransferase [Alicyclobacillus macrosporangiidus]|uniref:methylated-DNA--[protein]-cysteine S-methyltransferase n=1 Tax=Alicyclobacillus macrosporangiidus TaxID=392015 RepID=UPI0026F2BC6A|nr:methylated-DNA--[protein]-cysteine S-methyltransferase [Alicyclobacillus macrosporangiidus]